jgi:hypothetical protein
MKYETQSDCVSASRRKKIHWNKMDIQGKKNKIYQAGLVEIGYNLQAEVDFDYN